MPPSRADAFPLFGTAPPPASPGGLAPMQPPPGLEGLLGGEAEAGLPGLSDQWFQEVREAAAGRAGRVFEEKATDLWRNAEARLQHLEEQQSRTTGRLEEELRRCQEKHESLQREKSLLEQSVAQLQERMAAAEAALGLGTWSGWGQPTRLSQGLPLVRLVGPGGGAATEVCLESETTVNENSASGKYPTLPAFPDLTEVEAKKRQEAEAAAAPVAGEGGEEPKPPSPPAPPGLAPPSPPGSPRAGPSEQLRLAELVLLRSPQPTTTAARLEAAEAGRPEFLSPPPGPSTPRPTATPQRSGAWRSGAQPPPSTPPRTPQTRSSRGAMGTLTPMKSPAVPSSPFVHCESGGCTFGFMLRVADGSELGITTEIADDGLALLVTAVKPGGAIDSWNRQCVGGPSAGKAVMVDDKIVAVNGVTEPQAMLQELQDKRMLGLAVVRGEPDCDIPSQWTAQFAARERSSSDASKAKPWGLFHGGWPAPPVGLRSPGGLRAEAFEFVPGSLAAASPSQSPAAPPQPPPALGAGPWEFPGLE